MRFSLLIGLAAAAYISAQCTTRQFHNGSETKDLKDTVLIQRDAKGTFTVTCSDKRTETEVTEDAIKRGDVCKPVPQNTTVTQDKASATVIAFNAFNIWSDGSGTETFEYPQGYDVTKGYTNPDGVFYVEPDSYWKNDKFIGVPTEGAIVVNDVLEYPQKNGKQLKLKFSAKSPYEMNHPDAVKHCKMQGLRLPTIRELFDFCSAGLTRPKFGPNYEKGKYPIQGRCSGMFIWSASVHSRSRDRAWIFGGDYGYMDLKPDSRIVGYGIRARCVGNP